ncbi:hypothetical protein C8R45DRAFT_962837 [Mycena sanguinolenta]|nr:hypothetical protein C8R45DRAFT_962837 [Mycena sanguinolenta]
MGAQSLTGPDSKPLEVAQQRAVEKTAQEDEDSAEGSPIACILRAELGGPTKKRPTVTTIDKMRARYMEITKAVELMKEKYAEGANFRLPNDHPSALKGFLFKTEDIHRALRLKHTTINNDSKLFRYTRLRDDPSGKADKYVEDGSHGELFDKMSIKQWNQYLDDAKKEKENEERAKAREKARKRKHRQAKEGRKSKKRKGSKSDDEAA